MAVATGAAGPAAAAAAEPAQQSSWQQSVEPEHRFPLLRRRTVRNHHARFPSAATTGVPAGTPLRTVTGDVVVTQPGTVLDGLDVVGCLTVKAADVVVRRTRIRCTSPHYAIRVRDGGRNLLVQDSEIDGRGVVGVAVCCVDYTLHRVDIHSVIDGPRLGSRTTVLRSWIHDLARAPGSHNDALQSTGASDVLVRGNTLQAWSAKTQDPFNAALMLGTETSPSTTRMVVEDNYMDGGNYTVNIRKDGNYDGVVLRRNVFGRNHRYGPVLGVGPGISWSRDNVYGDTRSAVPIR